MCKGTIADNDYCPMIHNIEEFKVGTSFFYNGTKEEILGVNTTSNTFSSVIMNEDGTLTHIKSNMNNYDSMTGLFSKRDISFGDSSDLNKMIKDALL